MTNDYEPLEAEPPVQTSERFDTTDHWRMVDEARAAIANENVTTICEALRETDIIRVTVEFDGCGDSGQLEGTTACDAHGEVAIPGTTAPVRSLDFCDRSREVTHQPLEEAIETVCMDLLATVYGGWENGDGAYGTFTIDVATRSVKLEYNERYTDTRTYEHSFGGEA